GLHALQQARVGRRLARELLQRLGLAELRELVDELARIGGRERILVADLRHEQLGEHVGARGRAREAGARVRAARRGAAARRKVRLHGVQPSPSLSSDCCIAFTRPSTSTLVSKAREADIMSVISATGLTFG